MKKLTVLAICLFAAGSLFAQNNTATPKKTTAPKGAPTHTSAKGVTAKKKKDGPAVAGLILDGHRHPIADVQAFLYAKDSSIAASGYTDAMGRYETNTVLAGMYSVKFVYPEAKNILVTGVEIKKTTVPLNITADGPTADTSIAYTTLMPPPEKKAAGAHPKKK